MVPCAYLRVYEPLEALPIALRDRWQTRIQRGEGVISRAAAPATEAAAATATLVRGGAPASGEVAIVQRRDGRTLICPLRLKRRAAAAFEELQRVVPDAVMDAVVPDDAARAALETLSTSTPPHVQDAPWMPPMVWFAAFEPDERHLVDPPRGRLPRLTYETGLGAARERVATVSRIVAEAGIDAEEVVGDLADLGRHLDAFADDGCLELDYGGVAASIGGERLRWDRSCEDVWAALHALEDGDLRLAAMHYGALRSRWSRARLRRRAS